MSESLKPEEMNRLLESLRASNASYTSTYPGDSSARQPVHTVYGGAHLFSFNTTQKIGALALKSFQEHAKDPDALKTLFGWKSSELARKVCSRVEEKLKREAVEDFRIDFEDGFGHRSETEEDAEALRTAGEVARGMKEGTLSPYIGIRIKTFSEELKRRSLRTLDLFISTVCAQSGGALPAGFVVTLPKIVHVQQVKTCVDALEMLEAKNGLPRGAIPIELMVETPQSLFGYSGEAVLPSFVAAARGRCRGAHFGTYDFTASLNITADHQTMDHPSCDFARNVMKTTLAGTGVWLSDGATNVMPIGPDHESVLRVWALNYRHVQHSLKNAYYQGWDLHPAQLPVRYAALYSFFLADFEVTSSRLKHFIEQAAKATLVGNVFDDAATGQGLLNYFLRALNCGALTETEALTTGLTLDEFKTRSFKKILDGRSAH